MHIPKWNYIIYCFNMKIKLTFAEVPEKMLLREGLV